MSCKEKKMGREEGGGGMEGRALSVSRQLLTDRSLVIATAQYSKCVCACVCVCVCACSVYVHVKGTKGKKKSKSQLN